MVTFKTFAKTCRAFSAHKGGTFAVAFAGASAMLLLSLGYAVNVGQIYTAKSALLASLDTAVTSTARGITLGDTTKEEAPDLIRAFLTTNAQNSMLRGRDVQLTNLTIDDTARTVSATATVDLAMLFPVFQSGNTQHIEVSSAAVYSDKKIEVVMMLDVTGSMAEKNKLRDLKVAASNAVDTFFSMQDKKKERIRMAMVPYSTAVNAGRLAPSSVFVERSLGDRRGAPSNRAPRLVSNTASEGTCATERKGHYALSDVGPDVAMVNRDFFSKSRAGAECPSVAIVPLTTDSASLKKTIRKFEAAGTTAGHIGIQWSWYLLSSKWNSVLLPPAQPSAYDTKKTGKIAILMTDGLFNVEYSGAKEDDDVFVDNPNSGPARRSKQTAKALCAAMKEQGIEIFTIGFALTSDAKDTLRDCASADSGKTRHYFEAANGQELDDAFQTIARNVERLALTR
ncbi:MAG TPA: pilus assembly protein [Tianweitania sediminis]|jgi:Flp pilus assembly protein TadG|nr:pilus assembly protein [Tianweitania sediminis]